MVWYDRDMIENLRHCAGCKLSKYFPHADLCDQCSMADAMMASRLSALSITEASDSDETMTVTPITVDPHKGNKGKILVKGKRPRHRHT